MMNVIEHLTSFQIEGYYSGAFAKNESHEIGRHLLQCLDCRNQLPVPTPKKLWQAISTERDEVRFPDNEKLKLSESVLTPFEFINARLFAQNRLFAWTGGALIILLGCSFAIWIGLTWRATHKMEVAQIRESDISKNSLIQNETPENSGQFSFPTSVSETNSNAIGADGIKESPKNETRKNDRKSAVNLEANPKSPGNGRSSNTDNYSLTRGIDTKCAEENAIEMEFKPATDTILLKWKTIPNAAKYHLYVSDDNEILIDEFETEKGTSFQLNKQLDPAKNYKWKIVVTLNDGKSIVGDSLKFTLSEVQRNRIKPLNTGVNPVRCSAKN